MDKMLWKKQEKKSQINVMGMALKIQGIPSFEED